MKIFNKLKYDKYLLILLTAIYALFLSYFFSLYSPDFNNKIDGSWVYSIGSLRDSNQHIGSDIFFTYGPLSEKIITSVNSNDSVTNYITSVLLFLILVIINTYVFFRFAKLVFLHSNRKIRILFLSTFIAIALTLTSIESFFYITLLFTLFVANREENYYKKILLLVGVILFSLYKFNFTLPVLVLGPIAFISQLSIKNFVLSLIKWLPCIFLYSVFYLLMINTLDISGLVKYLYYGLASSIAYSEFMGLAYEKNLKVVIFYGLLMVINMFIFMWYLFIIHKNKSKYLDDKFIPFSVAYLFVSLLVFKHAVVRSDIHLLSYIPFLYISLSYMLLAGLLLFPRVKILQSHKKFNIFLVSSLLIFYILSIVLTSFVQFKESAGLNKLISGTMSVINFRINIVSNSIRKNQLNYYSFAEMKRNSLTGLNMYDSSIRETKEYLLNNNNKIIFYGNTTFLAEILDNSVNIQFMPYLQTYAAFPPKLFDDIYIEYINKYPEALIYAEELEPSIDERIPSLELNNYFQYLIHNYRIEHSNSQKNQFILKRYQDKHEVCSSIYTTNSKDNDIVHIPDINPTSNEYIKMKVYDNDIKDKIVDTGLSVLIKKPIINIGLINEKGKFVRRTTKSTLEHGISVNPLYQSIKDYSIGEPYNFDSFVIYDDIMTQNNYKIMFEKCTF